MPAKTVPPYVPSSAEPYEKPVAVIRYKELTIGISNEISDSLLLRILREVSHA